jgi:hypothetical protein
MASLENSARYLWEMNSMASEAWPKLEEEETLPNSFYKASIMSTWKLCKKKPKREIICQYPHLMSMQNTFKKFRKHNSQHINSNCWSVNYPWNARMFQHNWIYNGTHHINRMKDQSYKTAPLDADKIKQNYYIWKILGTFLNAG